MLVLNRKSDQEIVIDGNIRIKVLSVKGNTVRLGIEAPRDVAVLRSELVEFSKDTIDDSTSVTAVVPTTPPTLFAATGDVSYWG